jgi:hypothetical protein
VDDARLESVLDECIRRNDFHVAVQNDHVLRRELLAVELLLEEILLG